MALADDVDRRAARRAVALDFGDVAEVRNDRAANGANILAGLTEGKRLEATGLHRVSSTPFASRSPTVWPLAPCTSSRSTVAQSAPRSISRKLTTPSRTPRRWRGPRPSRRARIRSPGRAVVADTTGDTWP